MSTHSVQHSGDRDMAEELASELQAVSDELSRSLSALGSPLRELVDARVRASGPPRRAALVLAAGYNGPHGDAQNRIHLAAALEMLHTALGIHQLLLESALGPAPTQASDGQRSFIGSTILAGDFCFSHAAQMASKTGSPTVVAIFARALQDVSERRLRDLLSARAGPAAVEAKAQEEILLRSGAAAALELSDLPAEARPHVEALTNAVVAYAPADAWGALLAALPREHGQRWAAFGAWLGATAVAADFPR